VRWATDKELEKLTERIKQLEHRKQAELNHRKKMERKERTHRLYKFGELIEKYFGDITPEKWGKILKNYVKSNEMGA